MLADVSAIDTTVTAARAQLASPILAAPIGMLGVVHPDGEVGVVSAMAASGGLTVLATNATTSIEDAVAATGSGASPWLQLGSWADRSATQRLVERAEQAGAGAIVQLVNAPVPAQHVPWQVGFRPGPVELPNAPADQTPDPAQGIDHLEWLAALTSLPVIPKG